MKGGMYQRVRRPSGFTGKKPGDRASTIFDQPAKGAGSPAADTMKMPMPPMGRDIRTSVGEGDEVIELSMSRAEAQALRDSLEAALAEAEPEAEVPEA